MAAEKQKDVIWSKNSAKTAKNIWTKNAAQWPMNRVWR